MVIETTLTELPRYAYKLSSNVMNMNTNRANSVVSGVAGYEAQSPSPTVFVPSTTDTDMKRTMKKPIGNEKKKVTFPCEDIREKKKKIEDLKNSFLFYCTTSLLKGLFPLKMMEKQKADEQLKRTQENKVGVFFQFIIY